MDRVGVEPMTSAQPAFSKAALLSLISYLKDSSQKRTLLFKSHPLHLPNQLLYSAAFLHALLSLKEEKQQEVIYIETRDTAWLPKLKCSRLYCCIACDAHA
jgi:hypothetical protein